MTVADPPREVVDLDTLTPHPRNYRGHYCDVICTRFQEFTGIEPVLQSP